MGEDKHAVVNIIHELHWTGGAAADSGSEILSSTRGDYYNQISREPHRSELSMLFWVSR